MSPVHEVERRLPAPVPDVLAVSLDLDVELAAGARFGLRALPDGPRSRTAGRIGLGESVTWSLRFGGLFPLRHSSCIVELVEDDGAGRACFVDEMRRGLFAAFRHEHVLEPVRLDDRSAGTLMRDRMVWRSPLGALGRLADAVFVRRTLQALLRARNDEIGRRIASGRRGHAPGVE